MRRGGALLAAVATLGIVGAVSWHTLRASPVAADVEAGVGQAAVGPHVTWPGGSCYRYAFSWQSASGVGIPTSTQDPTAMPTALTVSVDAAGGLVLCSFGAQEGRTLMSARFEDVKRADVLINGKSGYPDAAAGIADLQGHKAAFDVDAQGRVQRLAVDGDPSGTFHHLIRALLLELQTTAPSGSEASWLANEPTVNGVASTRYAVDPLAMRQMRRVREHYVSLTGIPHSRGGGAPPAAPRSERPDRLLQSSGLIVVQPTGPLDRLQEEEHLMAESPGEGSIDSELHLSLDFVGAAPADMTARPSLEKARPLAELAVSQSMQRRMLEQRVAGMKFEQVRDDLTIYAQVQRVASQPRWMWRTSGLLVLEPERCEQLVALFRDLPGARALILDLLASAGTPPAQAAMRAAVSLPEALADEQLMLYVQRFSFVVEPELATLDLLWARWDAAAHDDGGVADALLYTVGSTTGHMLARGDREEAAASHGRLLALLDSAQTGHERRVALAALGNAGFSDDAGRIAAFQDDPDSMVRSQVAFSMRKLDGPVVRPTVVHLVGDRGPSVQATAIQVLSQWKLTPDELEELERLVAAQPLDASNCLAFVQAITSEGSAGSPHTLAMLRALLERNDLDAETRATIYDHLNQQGD